MDEWIDDKAEYVRELWGFIFGEGALFNYFGQAVLFPLLVLVGCFLTVFVIFER